MKLERRTREKKVARISPLTSTFLIAVLFGVVSSLLFFPIPQKAQITFPMYVNTTSDNVVAGACQAGVNNPGCSLRGAIMKANEGSSADVIFIGIPASDPFCAAGVCTINLTQALPDIEASVTINGPGADKLIVKPATGVNVRIFFVTATGTVGISGITMSNGVLLGGSGGGIWNGNGTLTITNSTISGNRSNGGSGGGILNLGTLNINNCTISGNEAGGTRGGGISNSGTLNLTNSTLSGNVASNTGGGIANADSGTSNITNSTISRNTAFGVAGVGGIHAALPGTVNVKNSIIALNSSISGPDVFGNFVSAGFNLVSRRDGSVGFTAATDQTGTNAFPLNPMLDPAGLQNNGGPTPTIALLIGSPAIDKGSSLGLTGNLATDQRGTTFLRTFDNRRISNSIGGDGTDIGAFERRESPYDFDGDGKTDIGVFRPSAAAEWWINRSSNGLTFALQFGAPTDRIATADYTGDGKADIAFWRPADGNWYVLRSEDNSFFAFPFGANGDIPAPADYDADGKADAAVFRPSAATWFISQSGGGGTRIFQFGINGDQPVVSDYDGDGKADVGIFRPGPREWWISRSTAGLLAMQFGNSGDKPVQGDYTGDGKTDVAIWRPSTGEWFIVRSENFSFFGFPFGTTGDTPAPGDYDGDGKFDATVFRPSSATWFIARSAAGTQIVQFGANGDRPLPNAYVP